MKILIVMLLLDKPGAVVISKFKTSLLAVILLMGIILGGRANAQSVSVTPSSGPGNAIVSITSSGFQPDQNNNYYNTGFYVDDGYRTACPNPGDSGYANCTVMLTMPLVVGPHTIKAANSLGQSATTTYTVGSPSLTVLPTLGPPGTSVTAVGSTFAASLSVAVYFDGSPVASAMTDESGNFSASFTVPAAADGKHTVSAIAGPQASAPFYVATNEVGRVLEVAGPATVTHPGGQPSPLLPGTPIQQGDVIQTGPHGRGFVLFADNTTFNVAENTGVTINNYVYDPNNSANDNAHYSVLNGIFQYLSGAIAKHNPPQVDALPGGIGIRGTQFISHQDPCSVTQEVYLIEGELAITPKAMPGVTNIVDAPASIFITSNSVTTNVLDQAMYDTLSNQWLNVTGSAPLGSWLTYYFGCTNDNAAAGTDADPDGDGVSNGNEFLAGTDPTSSASYFHILSAMPEGSNLRVIWMCGGGHTNVLQCTTALGGSWAYLSTNVLSPDSGDVTTNFVDVGSLPGTSEKYYRVQLIQ